MKRPYYLWLYLVLAAMVSVIDRLTKYWALKDDLPFLSSFSYLSFHRVMNRGVSWGWLHSENNLIFILLTLIISIITGALLIHTYAKLRSGKLVIGEILVVVGAFSNIVDRLIYGAVVDFLVLSWRSWSFPAIFNCADAAIVSGVLIMFLTNNYKENT